MFRMPKPGTPVVLLLSGGMDSVTAWHILIRRFRLIPYPFTVVPHLFDPKHIAVRITSRFIRSHYPSHYRSPFILYSNAVQKLSPRFNPETMDPDTILSAYNLDHNLFEFPRHWGNTMAYAHWAYLYAQKLNVEHQLPITTVFSGITADDGRFVASQSLTNLRLTQVSMMTVSQDDHWQFSSPFFEPSLGLFLPKSQVVQYAVREHISLRHSYSCDKNGMVHCGTCLSCQSRKYCFEKNNAADETWYMDRESLRNRLGRFMGKR